jgi:hypothetical protein
LLRASPRDPCAGLARTVQAHGGLVLSLAGLQPEQGKEQLGIVREVLRGTILSGENLRSASAEVLAKLLWPLADRGWPVLGVIRDAQAAIREAVRTVVPAAPPHSCPSHALRDAARPLCELDRPRAVPVRQEVGDLRALAVRPLTRTTGLLPCEFAGRRRRDDLHAVGTPRDRCLAKGGSVGAVAGGP